MSDSYPVLLDGKTKGTLQVTRDGLTTLFEARCENPGRLVRLSVFGDGAEGYLGVMAPADGGMYLRRKLSRTAMANFPARIEFAGEAMSRETAGKTPAAAPPPAAAPETEPLLKGGESGTDLLWYRAGDGSLFTTYQGRQFRAIPMAAHGLPTQNMVERRTIEGIDYAVFETKNGKIIG